MLVKGILGTYVAIGSLWDLKSKYIPLWFLLMGNLISGSYLVWQVMQHSVNPLDAGFALLPGMLLLSAALVAGGAIGIGDGLVWVTIGCILGMGDTCAGLLLGMVIAAVWGIILLIRKKGGRKTRLPFLPCSFLGGFLWIVMKPFL